MRLLIQSARTHEFLHSSPVTGDVSWTPSLSTALEFGVIEDWEEAARMADEYVDRGLAIIVSLDS